MLDNILNIPWDTIISNPWLSFSGFVIFFIYFYKTDIWANLLDNAAFSVICGIVIFLGFATPLVVLVQELKNFIIGYVFYDMASNEITFLYLSIYIGVITSLLILAFYSEAPLYNNIKVTKAIFLFYITFLCTLFLFSIELILAMAMSPYNDYILTVLPSLLFSFSLLSFFFLIFILVHKKSYESCFDYTVNFFASRMQRKHFILLTILLILVPIFTGAFLFNYKVMLNEEHIDNVSIEQIDILRREISSSNENVYRDYSINMPILVSWAKVKLDYSFERMSSEDEDFNYKISQQEDAFIVDKTASMVNFSVFFYNYTEIPFSKIVTYQEPIFVNNSAFINIILDNYLPYDLKIRILSVPLCEGYTLIDENFIKTQHFTNKHGGMQGYLIDDQTLYLTNLHLEDNSSDTIILKLTKIDT